MLLPPSEGKAAPKRGKPLAVDDLSFPALQEAREQAITALKGLCAGDPEFAARSLGLGRTQGDDVRRNARLLETPTARADAIYTGVLYEALDLPSLDTAARRRASVSLAITSSLFGLVRPADRIPPYRLSGGVNLAGLGVVSAHWRAVLDPAVREAAGNGLIVDLRSSTYAAFWRPDRDLAARVAPVRVLQQVGSQRMVVSHFNKATKGNLVRGLLERGSSASTPERLADDIADLGWEVELHEPGRHGQQVDVIVEEL